MRGGLLIPLLLMCAQAANAQTDDEPTSVSGALEALRVLREEIDGLATTVDAGRDSGLLKERSDREADEDEAGPEVEALRRAEAQLEALGRREDRLRRYVRETAPASQGELLQILIDETQVRATDLRTVELVCEALGTLLPDPSVAAALVTASRKLEALPPSLKRALSRAGPGGTKLLLEVGMRDRDAEALSLAVEGDEEADAAVSAAARATRSDDPELARAAVDALSRARVAHVPSGESWWKDRIAAIVAAVSGASVDGQVALVALLMGHASPPTLPGEASDEDAPRYRLWLREEVGAALREVFAAQPEPPEAVKMAVCSAVALVADEHAAQFLIDLLVDELAAPALRRQAVRSLHRLRSASAVQALLEHFEVDPAACGAALKSITKRDYGTSQQAWVEWHDRSRVTEPR